MADPTDSKRCPACGTWKSRTEFNKDRSTRDGLCCYCRECKNAYLRNAPRTEEFRARQRKATKKWVAANRERQLEAQRQWREKNPGYSAEANRRWREANPEAGAAYHAAHPGRTQERVRKRRAIKKAATVGPVDLDLLWTTGGGVCPLCAGVIDPAIKYPDDMSKSVDHIVPLAKGGTHEQANLQWVHLVCNKRKGSSDPRRT